MPRPASHGGGVTRDAPSLRYRALGTGDLATLVGMLAARGDRTRRSGEVTWHGLSCSLP